MDSKAKYFKNRLYMFSRILEYFCRRDSKEQYSSFGLTYAYYKIAKALMLVNEWQFLSITPVIFLSWDYIWLIWWTKLKWHSNNKPKFSQLAPS